MDVVKPANLGEKAGERFLVVLAEVDGPGPVVAPLDHGARLQGVGPYLIQVVRVARHYLRPVAELQQVLQVARPHQPTLLLYQFTIILKNPHLKWKLLFLHFFELLF